MATITIDIPTNDIPRVQDAFGDLLNLGRPANQNEITYSTKRYVIDTTQTYERKVAKASYAPPPMEMGP